MALCDFIIEQDIQGIDCTNPPVKGAESMGVLINRKDIDYADETTSTSPFMLNFVNGMTKCDTHGYAVYQSGKTPWNGTQQEMVEGTNANTITNTVQLVVLKQDKDWAQQLYALVNGEFVAILKNKDGSEQVYGYEAGLHCTGAVRELYNDDTLAGWQITFTEEGASKGNIFVPNGYINFVLNGYECD
jgi:hypothetical protein